MDHANWMSLESFRLLIPRGRMGLFGEVNEIVKNKTYDDEWFLEYVKDKSESCGRGWLSIEVRFLVLMVL